MNILLIIADALRSDHLHCYGYPKDTSPCIDKMAKEGVLFKNVVSNCNHTMPGLISIFTGLYQVTHGIDSQESFSAWEDSWIKGETALNILEKTRYVISGCDPQVYGKAGYKKEVIDVDRSIEENKENKFLIWYRSETTHLPYNPGYPYNAMFMPSDYIISDSTKERMEVIKNNLIVHRKGLLSKVEKGKKDEIEKPGYMRNVGITNLSEEDRPALLALYDGEVRTLDDEIKKYMTKLEELKLLDNTMIILTSDHGEQLMERGAVGHSSCSLEGNLYDENICIPLIIRYPKKLPQNKIVSKQVSQVDIIPTILDILKLEMPEGIEGRSLLPIIMGNAEEFLEEAYAMTQVCGWQKLDDDKRMVWCIRTPKNKLIYYYDPQNNNNRFEYFDLINDPYEKNNIYNLEDNTIHNLKLKLYEWVSKSKYRRSYNDMLDR